MKQEDIQKQEEEGEEEREDQERQNLNKSEDVASGGGIKQSNVSSMQIIFEDLWDKGDTVRKHSQDRRKIVEEFINLLNERSNIELEYSKGIKRISSNMKKLVQTKGDYGGMIYLYSADLQSKAQQSMSLGENIKECVINYLKDTLLTQDQFAKILSQESKKLEKDLQTQLDSLEKSKMKFLKIKREFDDQQVLNQIYSVTSSTSQDKKDKHKIKVAQTERDVQEYQFDYQENISKYNEFIDKYYPEQWRILQDFQKQEEERNDRIKESILKQIMLDDSYFKNIQYQEEQLGKTIEQCDLFIDLKKFVESNRTNKILYMPIEYEKFVSFVDCSMQRNRDSTQSLVIDKYTEDIIRQSIEQQRIVDQSEPSEASDIMQYVLDLLIRAWYDKPISEGEFKQSLNFRDSKQARQLLVLSFTYYSEIASTDILFENSIIKSQQQSQIESVNEVQIDTSKRNQISKESFLSAISDLQTNLQSENNQINNRESQFNHEIVQENILSNEQSKELISPSEVQVEEEKEQNEKESEQQEELQIQSEKIANEILPEVHEEDFQQILSEEPNNKKQMQKIFLYVEVIDHPIWKSRDFWEAASFDSAYEELKASFHQRQSETLKDSMMREKNTCFGQLVSVLQNMLLFSCDKREIKILLQKFSKLFYLSDDNIKQLQSIIENHHYQQSNEKSNASASMVSTY